MVHKSNRRLLKQLPLAFLASPLSLPCAHESGRCRQHLQGEIGLEL